MSMCFAALAALTATACTTQSDEQRAEVRGDVIPEMSSSEPSAALDDPTILAIFHAANTADMETRQLAAEGGTSKEVRDFGAMVVHDRTIVRQHGRDLAQRLGATPTPPADDASATAHMDAMATLRSKDLVVKVAPSFDAHRIAAANLEKEARSLTSDARRNATHRRRVTVA